MTKNTYLIFDVETTGLPSKKDYGAPVSEHWKWPRAVQVAYALCDPNETILEFGSSIIKPEGFTIPLEASTIHGITTERANQEGFDLCQVLENFQLVLGKATALVAHNMDFDRKIVGCEFFRKTGHDPLVLIRKFCTMKEPRVISYCAIPPFQYGNFKWPSLLQLHEKLFGTGFEGAHDAGYDVQATVKCFFELKRRGIYNQTYQYND